MADWGRPSDNEAKEEKVEPIKDLSEEEKAKIAEQEEEKADLVLDGKELSEDTENIITEEKPKEEPEKVDEIDKLMKYRKRKSFVTLLYGGISVGKTYTALTFPAPLYCVDTENRMSSNIERHFKDKDRKVMTPMSIKKEWKEGKSPISGFDSINKISKFVYTIVKKVIAGEIKKGTVIIDSASDLWEWIWRDWTITELSKRMTKEGKRLADPFLLKINNRFDWGIPNARHANIVNALRLLIFNGIYVVFTAREKKIPEYVKEKNRRNRDKIKCQSDLPYLADVVFRLDIVQGKYKAIAEKLDGRPTGQIVEKLSYEKIKQLLKEE